MSRVDDFVSRSVQRAREKGAPSTVHDHLIEDGKTVDAAEYRSLKAGTNRLLKAGERYHSLLGQVFVLPEHTRGRYPEGYGDNPPTAQNEHPPVVWTTGYNLQSMTEIIGANNFAVPDTPRHLQAAQQALATVSPTKQRLVMRGVEALVYEKKLADVEAAHMARENEELRRNMQAARERETFLQGLLGRLGEQIGNGNNALAPARK
jgi:hypothetical protein